MRERWVDVMDFPTYAVSNLGRVANNRSGRIMALARNLDGVIHVGMMRDGIQRKRSLARLVANHFLPQPVHPCNTPMHLDGDRDNNSAENLVWRPEWFSAKYHEQFTKGDPLVDQQIRDVNTGRVYESSWHAANEHGLLDMDVYRSVQRGRTCFPTYQVFELV